MNKHQAALRPTALLLLVFLAIGSYMYFFTSLAVNWAGLVSMMVFYGLIFYFGAYASTLRQQKDTDGVMLAGRSLPMFVAIFTMSATWVGGGYINGTAEYTSNASYGLVWVQAPWGYALSLIIGGLFFARKMRRHQFKTMLDPLSQRFGKRMTGLLFLPALCGEIFWTAAILTALGTTFGVVLGLDDQPAIILSALIAIAYTALGGLWAVALTDLVQLVLLFLGLFLVFPSALEQVGGWSEAWGLYQTKMGPAASFLPSEAALGTSYWEWWDFALLLMLGGIPWQVYFQRVLAAKNEKTAMWFSIFAGFICILAAIPAVGIGVIGSVADWQGLGLPEPDSPASILPHVMRYLTSPVVATIGLGAIAAAVMSSVDSSILSASSMASWNVYRPLIRPQITAAKLATIIKRCIWIIGIAATLLALSVTSVYELWFLSSDFVYCLLFPALVTALFDPKANLYGALAGFVVSAILRFGGGDGTLGIEPFIDYTGILEGGMIFPFRTLAMLSGLLTIIIVSRLTQKYSPAQALKISES